MKPIHTFKAISKKPTFLRNTYLIDLLITSALTALLFNYRDYSDLSLAIENILLLIPATIAGWIFSSYIHNASHGNFKGTFINRIMGEISGAWLLYGFTNFILIHILHHKYSDTDNDPVSPEGMTFLVFLSAPMRYMITRAKKYLRKCHGQSRGYELVMTQQVALFHAILVLRLVFFAALFGPTLFLFFYLPSLAANISILAHINYACHRNAANGEVEVVNLDHNLYYKVANFVTMGGYYHKNHHLNTNLFDPRHLKTKSSREKLITVEATNLTPLRPPQYAGSFVSRYFDIHDIWGEAKKNEVSNINQEKFVFNIYKYKI